MFSKVLQRLGLCAALLVTLLAPRAAGAQVRRWSGPVGCDDGDALFARVHAPALDIDAMVTVVDGRLQLRLLLEREGERWERVVAGDSCEALVEVAIVVATMAAELPFSQTDAVSIPCESDCLDEGTTVNGDGATTDDTSPRESAGDLETRARALPGEVAPRDADDADSGGAEEAADAALVFAWAPGWSLSAHAGMRFDALSLPSPRAAVDLGMHLRSQHLRVDVGFLATRVASVTLNGVSSGAIAELGLAAGRLGACGGATAGRFWLGGCGALELGVVRAAGSGVDEPRNESSFWAGVDLAVRAELGAVGRLSVYLEAGAMVPLRRPRFLLQTLVVHSTPALSPRAALGLEVRLTR